MQSILIVTLALHVLASVFWAGSTFALARAGGSFADQLFRPQLGAATVAILSGTYLWHLLHAGAFGRTEQALAIAAGSAVVAFAVQISLGKTLRDLRAKPDSEAALRPRVAAAQRVASGLLMVTVIAMAIARYV